MHKVKKYSLGLLALLSLFWFIRTGTHISLPTAKNPTALFSNNYSHKMVMIEAIASARSSIDLAMFALTDKEIVDQLNLKACKIPIRLFYDPKQSLPKLHPAIITIPKSKMRLMHRKILVIDKKLSLLGSANFTKPSLLYHKNEMLAIYSPQVGEWLAVNLDVQKVDQTFFVGKKNIRIFLMPNVNALPALIEKINRAKRSIIGQLFCLNHPKILAALSQAKKRGVKVHFTLDKGQGNRKRNEFAITFAKGYELMHSKSCQIDRTKIIGSANWTKAGFKSNGEVLVIID